jgi:hypothetical protein
MFNKKIFLEIDFGQAVEKPIREHRLLKDSNGENMPFNSFVDALNFMYKVVNYILERRKDF